MTSSIRWLTRIPIAFLMVHSAPAWPQADAGEQIRVEIKSAQTAYDLGQFDEALNHFSEGYRLDPLPGILFNLAQCHRQLGHWERAAFFYRRFLALAKDKPDEALVSELIAEVEQ